MINVLDFENANSLKEGDVIVRNKSVFGIIDHYGLYVGNGIVIDNHPTRGVREIDLSVFLNGRNFQRIKHFGGNRYDRKGVIDAAYSMYGKPYHLTKFNCEHFVNEVWGMGRKSQQVDTTGVLFFFSLVIWGLSKVS